MAKQGYCSKDDVVKPSKLKLPASKLKLPASDSMSVACARLTPAASVFPAAVLGDSTISIPSHSKARFSWFPWRHHQGPRMSWVIGDRLCCVHIRGWSCGCKHSLILLGSVMSCHALYCTNGI